MIKFGFERQQQKHLINFVLFIYALLMLKNIIIVFPPKPCQILPSLLVWSLYKMHSLLATISCIKSAAYTRVYTVTHKMLVLDFQARFCDVVLYFQ